jgi:hypothetical protein
MKDMGLNRGAFGVGDYKVFVARNGVTRFSENYVPVTKPSRFTADVREFQLPARGYEMDVQIPLSFFKSTMGGKSIPRCCACIDVLLLYLYRK